MSKESALFTIDYTHDQIPQSLISFLNKELYKLANSFAIASNLITDKLQIIIFEWQEFNQIKQILFKNIKQDYVIAISTNKVITALSHQAIINQYSADKYNRIILHECIHLMQARATGVNPTQATWLYESVACYLAGQKWHDDQTIASSSKSNAYRQYSTDKPSWHKFTTDFYNCPLCYKFAYQLGAALLCNKHDFKSILCDIQRCNTIGEKIYNTF